MRRGGIGFFLAGVILVLGAGLSPALGSGFALLQQGTAAMAQGNAFVAQADDPTAVYYNPAGLIQLQRPEIYLGQVINYPSREYKNPAGADAKTKHRFFFTPTVYAASPLGERFAVGIGYFSPFGLSTTWPSDWVGRYLITSSKLHTHNLNPTVAYKIADQLQVGVGLNILWSSIELQRKFLLPTFRDGEQNISGDGTGVGYNLGFLFELLEGVKLGAAYRSEVRVTYHTDFKATLSPTITSAATVTFPPSLSFGVAVARFKPLVVEVDATWTGWSTYNELRLDLEQPILVNRRLTYRLVQPKEWRDTWAIRFGANYELSPGMKLRAGYIYDLTPVPDDTFDPQVPDADRHIITLGGELKIDRFTLGLAYNYIIAESRTKTNVLSLNGVPYPAAAQARGRYDSSTHSLGLSLAGHF